jgi:hypothetical protein
MIPKTSSDYESNLKTLKDIHHSQCLFNCNPPVPDFRLWFDDGGILFGEFTCTQDHQGYNGVAHGGLVAAIIDSSMVQCLMGHGVVGYTTYLSIKYRKPIVILQPTSLKYRDYRDNIKLPL